MFGFLIRFKVELQNATRRDGSDTKDFIEHLIY